MSMSYEDCQADIDACGYNRGYEDGYIDGYEEGQIIGKEDGYRKIAIFLIKGLMNED